MNYHDDCLAVRPIVCPPCDQSRDLCEIDEEGEGARTINPGFKPSVEEVNNHNLTHIPFRSWCPFCVAGKAKDNPHFRVDQEDSDMNILDMDYMFLSGKEPSAEVGVDQVSDEEEEEEEEAEGKEKSMPVLVSYDRRHKYVFARVVPRKGAHPYTIRRVGQDITKILGYNRVHIKSDQERAIKKIKSQVRLEYSIEVPEEEARVGDSRSNGQIESIIQQVQGQIRTLKAQLEHRIKLPVPDDHALLPWLISHAGATMNRYSVGKDGATPYKRLKGRSFQRPIAEFGECIWYLKHKTSQRGKLQPRWASGVFLGIREESGEIIVGTDQGVIKSRTFRRKGVTKTDGR